MQKTSLFSLFCLLLWVGCANVVAPQGGQRDTTPPKIDSARSTRFGLTNFKGKQFTITFDEWVTLENPQEILISPPIPTRPEITLKNKSVVVKWKDSLYQNTTYSFNFGKSVKDYTEGNSAVNLRMVFSTGNQLDSLRLNGAVVDAVTAEPSKEVWVQLYDATKSNDSTVAKKLPLYFTMTDETGHFTITNIKAGVYKIIALKDLNGNYKYDQEGEGIAFLNEPIEIPTQKNLVLQLFEQTKPLKVQQTKAFEYGRTDLVFTDKPIDVKIDFLDKSSFKTTLRKDTMSVWHKKEGKQAILVTIPSKTKPDTIRFNAPLLADAKNTAKLKPQAAASSGRTLTKGGNNNKKAPDNPNTVTVNALQRITKKEPLRIDFGRPIASIEVDKIVMMDSSKNTIPVRVRQSEDNIGLLYIEADYKDKVTYNMRLLPNAIKDDYGRTNDTIIYNLIKKMNSKELGSIIIKLENLEASNAYVFELLDNNKNTLKTVTFEGKTAFNTTFTDMFPDSYGFRLITDDNRNGRYDSGNYYEHRQPEKIRLATPQTLRPNWELELSNGGRKKTK